jgi:hypothetical protein
MSVAVTTTEGSALSPDLHEELLRNASNPRVGQILVSQSDRARVWFIRLRPGERLAFHRHVLDYFWTALSAGRGQSHINGGPAQAMDYTPGMTRHQTFGAGESMIHDLENVGDTDLIFLTMEHLQSANAPLPLPAGVVPAGLPHGLDLS